MYQEAVSLQKRIPFPEIPHQSKLFLEYLQDSQDIRRFYRNRGEDPRSFSKEVLAKYQIDRNLLCDALEKINIEAGAGGPTLENIRLLREDDTLAVVTGQQAGLFSGPLYTIYKALSAIKESERLRKIGIKAVPIFWIAEEDHDFAEVSYTSIIDGEGKPARIENIPGSYSEKLPVGGIRLDSSISGSIQEIFEMLPKTQFSEVLRNILSGAYSPGERFSLAFARFLAKLFEGFGLIFVLPMDHVLKKLCAPFFLKSLERSDEIKDALLQRNKELSDSGYQAQVLVDKDYFPFFEFDKEGKREKVAKGDIKNIESLSPSALMRPVIQDYLFPTIRYFGGAAEIAYFSQSEAIYRILGRPLTPIAHRASITLVNPREKRTLDKYDIKFSGIFSGKEHLSASIIERSIASDTAKVFSGVEEEINAQLNLLDRSLVISEPSLAESLAKRRRKIMHHIATLRKKFHQAEIRKDEVFSRRINSLFGSVLPDGALQERSINIISFLNLYGMNLIKWIYDDSEIEGNEHQVIYL